MIQSHYWLFFGVFVVYFQGIFFSLMWVFFGNLWGIVSNLTVIIFFVLYFYISGEKIISIGLTILSLACSIDNLQSDEEPKL